MRALAGLRPACDAVLVLGAPDAEGGRLVRDSPRPLPGCPRCSSRDRVDGRGGARAMSAGARGVVGAEPRARGAWPRRCTAVGERAGPERRRRQDGRRLRRQGRRGRDDASRSGCAAAGGLVVDASAGRRQRPSTSAAAAAVAGRPRPAGRRRSAATPSRRCAPGIRRVRADRRAVRAGAGRAAARGLGAALARECRAVAGTTVFDLGVPDVRFRIEAARCADAVLLVVTPDALSVRAAAARVGGLVRRGATWSRSAGGQPLARSASCRCGRSRRRWAPRCSASSARIRGPQRASPIWRAAPGRPSPRPGTRPGEPRRAGRSRVNGRPGAAGRPLPGARP